MRLRTLAVSLRPSSPSPPAPRPAPASAPDGDAAPARPRSGPNAPPPALEAITEAELRRDVFAMASDSMRGREAGELDEMRASVWVAERAREAGLLPAGDDGTYFQFFPLRRVRIAGNSRVSAGRRGAGPGARRGGGGARGRAGGPARRLGGRGARGGRWRAWTCAARRWRPSSAAPNTVPVPEISLWSRRYTQAAVRDRAAFLAERGAAAVILVSDSVAETQFDVTGAAILRGRYALSDGTRAAPHRPRRPCSGCARLDAGRACARPGQRLVAELATESFVYPSVNVVAVAPGADPALRGEYVLFSGHQDHDGMRVPVDGDTIWNGADDNATVSVAMLAIGRAFARQPGRRSALFVWHGAEERGLLGSRWFVRHPTVPRESIAAVLNGDMIGRNHPDSAALLGVLPPHRSSGDLVEMADARQRGRCRASPWTARGTRTHAPGGMVLSQRPPALRLRQHPVRSSSPRCCTRTTTRRRTRRSASTSAKLTRATRWMYATGWLAAQADQRPRLEPGFRLERPCTP